jgi:hypothetical protein
MRLIREPGRPTRVPTALPNTTRRLGTSASGSLSNGPASTSGGSRDRLAFSTVKERR